MKRVLSMLVLLSFIVLVSSSAFAATPKKAPTKTPKKVIKVNKTKKTKSAKNVKSTSTAPQVVEVSAPQVSSPKCLVVKGGLAGGAALIAAEYMMPVGPMNLGGELGYAVGSGFGIVDLGAKMTYSMGAPFIGLELSYAGYSKDVKNVPGLSGTVKSGIGIGLIGGYAMGPIQAEVGYNTILGLRADVGYRIML